MCVRKPIKVPAIGGTTGVEKLRKMNVYPIFRSPHLDDFAPFSRLYRWVRSICQLFTAALPPKGIQYTPWRVVQPQGTSDE